MIRLKLILMAVLLSIPLLHFWQTNTYCEKPLLIIPDEALCAEKLRFGKEAYLRGRYLDAKEHFRKAVQADPTSLVAWRYYDQATIFALAEKVEKDANLTLPDVSTRGGSDECSPRPTTKPSPKSKPSEKKMELKMFDDEGC